MARYRIDEDRSTITVEVRPPMGLPRVPAGVAGEVEVADDAVGALGHTSPRLLTSSEVAGSLQVIPDGQTARPIDLATAADDAGAELSRGPDEELVLRGRRSSPADAFGIIGPPLVNPTLHLSWRLVLAPPEKINPSI